MTFFTPSTVLLLYCYCTYLRLTIDGIVIKDDHVEAMEGLEQVDLSFEGLQMLLDIKGNGKKEILDGSLRGRAQPGRMLAIMGPSGAGKGSGDTSLKTVTFIIVCAHVTFFLLRLVSIRSR
jgi:hypothetical protein